MNKTRILFGVTVALLLAVCVGLYVENKNMKSRGADKEPAEEPQAVASEPVEAGLSEVAVASEVEKKLAMMEEEIARQNAVHEREMLSLRENMAKTEIERDEMKALNEKFMRQKQERVAQIVSASKLTTIIEVFPEQGFVVIGAGDTKNVTVGQRFRVRRGDRIVGQIEVSSVDETNAVADPIAGSLVREPGDDKWFLVGDEVVSLE